MLSLVPDKEGTTGTHLPKIQKLQYLVLSREESRPSPEWESTKEVKPNSFSAWSSVEKRVDQALNRKACIPITSNKHLTASLRILSNNPTGNSGIFRALVVIPNLPPKP